MGLKLPQKCLKTSTDIFQKKNNELLDNLTIYMYSRDEETQCDIICNIMKGALQVNWTITFYTCPNLNHSKILYDNKCLLKSGYLSYKK